MTGEPTNATRAARIDAALQAYANSKGEVLEVLDFRDMLTDMMHFADREKLDFNHELSQATDNYSEEI